MKKITILLFVIVSMTFSINAQFGGGDGSAGYPFIISNAEHLNNVRYFSEIPEVHFRLEAWFQAPQFETIENFRGTFDGEQWWLFLNKPFVKNNYGTIKNLGIYIDYTGDGPTSTWEGGFGAIACNQFGTAQINNCFVNGVIRCLGKGQIGGIVGVNSDYASIYNCKANVRIESYGENVGGIVGYSMGNKQDGSYKIERCNASGTIIGTKNVGGIAGTAGGGTMSFCYTYTMVYGDENIGGLVGNSLTQANEGLYSCYSQGIVKGKKNIGGFVGYTTNLIFYYPCYTAAIIDSSEAEDRTAGYFVGYVLNNVLSEYMTYVDGVINDGNIQHVGNLGFIPNGWLFNTPELMASNLYGQVAPNTYPHFPINPEFDYWKGMPILEYFQSYNNSMINDIIKWDCFGSNIYTSWSQIARNREYTNYKNCGLFERLNCVYPASAELSRTAADIELQKAHNILTQEVKIYPNPTTGMLYIEGVEENTEITVYDLSGAVIIETNGQTVDMTSYTKGMYILNINGQMEKIVKK